MKNQTSPGSKNNSNLYSLDYLKFLDKIETGNPIERYLGFIVRNNLRGSSGDKNRVSVFLKKHTGLSYEQFIEEVKPENIHDNSYGLFNRASIKRNLFQSRSQAYLEALCDYEEQGGNIEEILDRIREEYIPTLKKEKGKEPTFEAIYHTLKYHGLKCLD